MSTDIWQAAADAAEGLRGVMDGLAAAEAVTAEAMVEAGKVLRRIRKITNPSRGMRRHIRRQKAEARRAAR